MRFTPRIERHPDALLLDLHGSERLLLGEPMSSALAEADIAETPEEAEWPVLAAALHGILHREVQTARARPSAIVSATPPSSTDSLHALQDLRVGLGPSRTVAWLAATVGDPLQRGWRAVAPSGVAGFLAPLPLDVLCAAPDLVRWPAVESLCSALAQAGVRRVEQLVRLPALAIERRFGAAGTALVHVATGRDLLPFHVTVPDTWLGARLRFPATVEAEHLSAALAPVAARLAKTLADRYLTACAVALTLSPECGEPLRAVRHLQHPVASTDALLAPARQLLLALIARVVGVTPPVSDALDAGDAGDPPPRAWRADTYVAIRLGVGALGPQTADQLPLWSDEGPSTSGLRRARLLAALYAQQTRTGWHHHVPLLRAVAHDPDAVLPEERHRLVPWELL